MRFRIGDTVTIGTRDIRGTSYTAQCQYRITDTHGGLYGGIMVNGGKAGSHFLVFDHEILGLHSTVNLPEYSINLFEKKSHAPST